MAIKVSRGNVLGSPLESVDYLSDEEMGRLVDVLRATDLKTANFDWLKKTLMRLSKGLVLDVPIYHSGLSLYRARRCKTRPALTSELGYPPASKVGSYGRANKPRQPMFYLNTQRNAVFFEMNPGPGDLLAVSHWTTVDKLLVFPVGYSDRVFQEKTSNRSKPRLGPGDHPLLMHPSNRYLEDFFAVEFTKEVPNDEPWRFKISAALAETRLSPQRVDGVMYPTVAMRANSDNFALRPSSAKKLKLLKAEFVQIDKVKDFSFEVTVLDTATEFPDGTLAWKGKPKWTLRKPGEMLRLVVENGQWRAYDMDGNVREFD